MMPAQHGVVAAAVKKVDPTYTWYGFSNASGVSTVPSSGTYVDADVTACPSSSAISIYYKFRADETFTINNSKRLFSGYNDGTQSGNDSAGWRIDGNGKLRYNGSNLINGGITFPANGSIGHMVLVFDGPNVKLRIDGSNLTATITSQTWNLDGLCNCDFNGTTPIVSAITGYKMTMYEMKMTNLALTDSQIDVLVAA